MEIEIFKAELVNSSILFMAEIKQQNFWREIGCRDIKEIVLFTKAEINAHFVPTENEKKIEKMLINFRQVHGVECFSYNEPRFCMPFSKEEEREFWDLFRRNF
jgi:hypothetical protein